MLLSRVFCAWKTQSVSTKCSVTSAQSLLLQRNFWVQCCNFFLSVTGTFKAYNFGYYAAPVSFWNCRYWLVCVPAIWLPQGIIVLTHFFVLSLLLVGGDGEEVRGKSFQILCFKSIRIKGALSIHNGWAGTCPVVHGHKSPLSVHALVHACTKWALHFLVHYCVPCWELLCLKVSCCNDLPLYDARLYYHLVTLVLCLFCCFRDIKPDNILLDEEG